MGNQRTTVEKRAVDTRRRDESFSAPRAFPRSVIKDAK
jgi:hypothetical protein